MPHVTPHDIETLKKDPLSYAVLMEDRDIEDVIVTFVSVLNKRKRTRGDQH